MSVTTANATAFALQLIVVLSLGSDSSRPMTLRAQRGRPRVPAAADAHTTGWRNGLYGRPTDLADPVVDHVHDLRPFRCHCRRAGYGPDVAEWRAKRTTTRRIGRSEPEGSQAVTKRTGGPVAMIEPVLVDS